MCRGKALDFAWSELWFPTLITNRSQQIIKDEPRAGMFIQRKWNLMRWEHVCFGQIDFLLYVHSSASCGISNAIFLGFPPCVWGRFKLRNPSPPIFIGVHFPPQGNSTPRSELRDRVSFTLLFPLLSISGDSNNLASGKRSWIFSKCAN